MLLLRALIDSFELWKKKSESSDGFYELCIAFLQLGETLLKPTHICSA